MKPFRGTLLFVGLILLVLAVACSAEGEPGWEAPAAQVTSFSESASSLAMPAPAVGVTDYPAPTLLQSDENTPIGAERRIVRTVNMMLLVPGVEESLEEVSRLAEEMGGFVVSSHLSGQEESNISGFISLRVPVEQVEATLTRLRGMAVRVPQEQSNSQDVTEEYVDLVAHLNNLKVTEEQLARLMERADTVEEVLNVQRELTNIRGQIESIKGRMQYLERTSAMSLISLRLLPVASSNPLSDPGWSVWETVKEAVRSFSNAAQGLANTAIWLAIFSPFWAPPLVAVVWVARRLARRLVRPVRQEGRA